MEQESLCFYCSARSPGLRSSGNRSAVYTACSVQGGAVELFVAPLNRLQPQCRPLPEPAWQITPQEMIDMRIQAALTQHVNKEIHTSLESIMTHPTRLTTSWIFQIHLTLNEEITASGSKSLFFFYPTGPPKVSERVNHRQSIRLGRTLKLPCPVEGDPPPLIMWTKDGRNIHSGWTRFRVLQHALRIKEVETDDAGTYICKATNGFGSVNVNYTLIVIGK